MWHNWIQTMLFMLLACLACPLTALSAEVLEVMSPPQATELPSGLSTGKLPEAVAVPLPDSGKSSSGSTSCSPLRFTSSSQLPPAYLGRSYTCRLLAAGAYLPLRFSLAKESRLPQGLSLSADGVIQGTPLETGDFQFRIHAADQCPAGSRRERKSFTLRVAQMQVGLADSVATLSSRMVVPVQSATSFAVTDIRLGFDGGESVATVLPERPLPGLTAVLRVNGRGTIRGSWIVDSVLRLPFEHAVAATQAAVVFPDPGKLPMTTGHHQVAFTIVSPGNKRQGATARYIVPPRSRGEEDAIRPLVVAIKASGAREIQLLVRKYNLRLLDQFVLESLGFTVLVFSGEGVSPDMEQRLRMEQGVQLTQRSRRFDTLAEPDSDLQQIARDLNFTDLHDYSRGRGVRVAVVDTGVDTQHRDLDGQVETKANLVKESSYRAEIHGTAIAGIIGAATNGFGIEGIAPGVRIMALRACEQLRGDHPAGRGDTASIAKALDTAMTAGAKVVNMSFGAREVDPLLAMLLSQGRKKGVLFVAPVGNLQNDGSSFFPASSRDVIAVGGVDARGGPYPDGRLAADAAVKAPAVNILTTVPGNRHNYLTGTSMSAAIVSGILALAVEKRPELKRGDLPPFSGDLCRWTETLVAVSICSR